MSILGAKTVVGIFASAAAAEEARAALLRVGVPESRMALSAGLTEDAIAAEVPGQSYENQPGQPADPAGARFGEAVRSGACVVSVFTRSEEERQLVEELLRRSRAYRTAVRP